MQLEGSIVPWKTLIVVQLKQHNQQQNYFDSIIKNYSQIWESRENLQSQCRKLEHDLNSLRLANSNLEKNAGASEELDRVNIKLKETNEEIVQQLRENSKLAREILRLNLTVEELNEKYVKEETKARQYQIENEELRQKLKETESNLAELQHVHQNVLEEVEPMRDQLKNLQNQYKQWNSTFLTLRQQLEEAERAKKHLEAEVIFQKNRQAEMHDLEIARNNQSIKKSNVQHSPDTNIFFDDDVVIISSTNNGNPFQDTMYPPEHESISSMRKTNSQDSIKKGRSGLFNNFIRKISTGISMDLEERAYRPSISCGVASIPNKEVTHWDCTDLEVYSLQFQPFGSMLATGCSDKYLRLWEISSTGYQHKYCTLECTSGSIYAIDFDNEGRRLIAGCAGNQAHLWSYGDTKTLKDSYTGHGGQIFTCKFLPGSKLATGSADRSIKVWDIATRQCIRTLLIGSKCHDLVVMDATGTLISGHYDKKIRIWDPNDDRCRTELDYDASITSLAFNDARQQLLACFRNDILRLIDLRQNKPLFTFGNENFKVKTDTSKAILSPDGQYACAGSHDGSLIFWNMEQKTCERVLQRRHSTMVTGVAWHPEGKYVASCEKHRRVILWSD